MYRNVAMISESFFSVCNHFIALFTKWLAVIMMLSSLRIIVAFLLVQYASFHTCGILKESTALKMHFLRNAYDYSRS